MEWPEAFYELKRGEGCPMCEHSRGDDAADYIYWRDDLFMLGVPFQPFALPLLTYLMPRLIGQWIARLGRIWTEGQITQLTRRPGSGIVFLTLRDPVADVSLQVTSSSVVMEGAGIPISEGQRVIVLARPEFYVPRGTLTLSAEQIQPVGLGELLARMSGVDGMPPS